MWLLHTFADKETYLLILKEINDDEEKHEGHIYYVRFGTKVLFDLSPIRALVYIRQLRTTGKNGERYGNFSNGRRAAYWG